MGGLRKVGEDEGGQEGGETLMALGGQEKGVRGDEAEFAGQFETLDQGGQHELEGGTPGVVPGIYPVGTAKEVLVIHLSALWVEGGGGDEDAIHSKKPMRVVSRRVFFFVFQFRGTKERLRLLSHPRPCTRWRGLRVYT